jgi:hypothetical protein
VPTGIGAGIPRLGKKILSLKQTTADSNLSHGLTYFQDELWYAPKIKFVALKLNYNSY